MEVIPVRIYHFVLPMLYVVDTIIVCIYIYIIIVITLVVSLIFVNCLSAFSSERNINV